MINVTNLSQRSRRKAFIMQVKNLNPFLLIFSALMSASVMAAEKNRSGFAVMNELNQSVSAKQKNLPQGVITETMNVSGYTYFRFEADGKKTWAATSTMELSKGDKVVLTRSFPMHSFKSKSLNRTFDEILFVSELDVVR